MKESDFKPYLNIYVVWHPDFKDGQNIAEQIYSCFNHDINAPLARGIGIPVYFRSVSASEDVATPLPINLNEAHRSVVIVLINSGLGTPAKKDWQQYIRNLYAEIEESKGNHRMFPVSMTQPALSAGILEAPNFIRYHDFEAGKQNEHLLIWLTHELGRFLGEPRQNAAHIEQSAPPVKIFISHAKRDGLELAEKVLNAVSATPADKFFDKFDIAPGHDFAKEIAASVSSSVLLVIQTDAYSTRPWCRREVLKAKELQCPIIVVNALNTNEIRSFPYLGNVPVIRWTGENLPSIIGLALLEYLRFSYFRKRIENLVNAGIIPETAQTLLRAPELVDCHELIHSKADCEGANKLVIYPDPPLGAEEMESLASFCPVVDFLTPTMPFKVSELSNLTIGLSISGSEDLGRLGFEKVHLENAMSEFARHLLAAGAKIAYGGIVGEGFTETLFDLVRTHNGLGATFKYEPIQSFLAWDYYVDISEDEEANRYQALEINRVKIPKDVAEKWSLTEKSPKPKDLKDVDNKYLTARCLTEMREEMTGRIDARLLMGGKLSRYTGKYPGLFEEAYITLRENKPLFLVGAFGGCTGAIIDLLLNGKSETLNFDYQARNNAGYADLAEEYKKQADNQPELNLEKIDYDSISEFIASKGIKGLNNGLTEEENRRLFKSVNFAETCFLTLRGLSRLVGG